MAAKYPSDLSDSSHEDFEAAYSRQERLLEDELLAMELEDEEYRDLSNEARLIEDRYAAMKLEEEELIKAVAEMELDDEEEMIEEIAEMELEAKDGFTTESSSSSSETEESEEEEKDLFDVGLTGMNLYGGESSESEEDYLEEVVPPKYFMRDILEESSSEVSSEEVETDDENFNLAAVAMKFDDQILDMMAIDDSKRIDVWRKVWLPPFTPIAGTTADVIHDAVEIGEPLDLVAIGEPVNVDVLDELLKGAKTALAKYRKPPLTPSPSPKTPSPPVTPIMKLRERRGIVLPPASSDEEPPMPEIKVRSPSPARTLAPVLQVHPTALVPAPPLAPLAGDQLIPDLGEESSGVDLLAQEVFPQFAAHGRADVDEFYGTEQEYLDLVFEMKELEEFGPTGVFHAGHAAPVSQEVWYQVAAKSLKDYLKKRVEVPETKLNELNQVVPVRDVEVIRDMLHKKLEDMQGYVFNKLDQDMAGIKAESEPLESLGDVMGARELIMTKFADISTDFEMAHYNPFYDSFRQLLGFIEERLKKDLQDIELCLQTDEERHLRGLALKKALGARKSAGISLHPRMPWIANVPENVRHAMLARVKKLFIILQQRIMDSTYIDMDFATLWLAMKRTHLRLSELFFCVTGKHFNRVNTYLGFKLNELQFNRWQQPRASEVISDEEVEGYTEADRELDEILFAGEMAKPDEKVTQEKELENEAIRDIYPNDIPLTEQEGEPGEGAPSTFVDTGLADAMLERLKGVYEDLKEFHREIKHYFSNLELRYDTVLRLQATLGAYVTDVIPKWIKAEAAEARRRGQSALAPEVTEAVERLEERLVAICLLPAYRALEKLFNELVHSMNDELKTGEKDSRYTSRLPSDPIPEDLLKDAKKAVEHFRLSIANSTERLEDIRQNIGVLWDELLDSHRKVKKFAVVALGSGEETGVERILGQELARIVDLQMLGRVIETFEQIAEREARDQAVAEKYEEKLQHEETRAFNKQYAREADEEQDALEMADARQNEKPLKFSVLRIIHPWKRIVRSLEQFSDDAKHMMQLALYPQAFVVLFDKWRDEAMEFINEEAAPIIRNAYKRTSKKKDKVLLKREVQALNELKDKFKTILADHSDRVVQFLVSCRNKLREQYPLVDINEYNFNDAMRNMNYAVAMVERSPWTARDQFFHVWKFIEELHLRLKELIFLASYKHGPTALEKYLGNILVSGAQVARGETPFTYEAAEPVGPEDVGELPPALPEPERNLEVIFEGKKKKEARLTSRQKKEIEALARMKEEEERKKTKKKIKRRRRKLDPATARIIEEKAAEKAAKVEAENEARRVAKEARDAKKRALDEERRMKHEKLTHEARKLKASLKRVTGAEGEEVAAPGAKLKKRKKKEMVVVDVIALEQELLNKKIAELSTTSRRPTQQELTQAAFEARTEAQAAFTPAMHEYLKEKDARDILERKKMNAMQAIKASKKAEKEAERAAAVERIKAQKSEELRAKIDAAKEALRKRREAEGGRPKKAISEAAQRRRQAAAMVSKPGEGPVRMKKKKKAVEEAPGIPALTEKELKKLKEVEDRKQRELNLRREKKAKEDARNAELGYPGISSFGMPIRERNAVPPTVTANCGHNHTHDKIRKYTSLLDLLRKEPAEAGYTMYKIGAHLAPSPRQL